MKVFEIIVLSLIWTVGITQGVPKKFPAVKYQHFEDYLRNLDAKDQAWLTGEHKELDDDDNPFPIRFINYKPKGHEKDDSCCMLGHMAGDKGYHCYAKFYADRLLLRNRNRAHNRKMAFHGHDKVLDYGQKVMKTFDHCVAGRGATFHRCCRVAAMEKKAAPHYDYTRRWMEINGEKIEKVHKIEEAPVKIAEEVHTKKFALGKLLRKLVRAAEYFIPSET